MPQVFAIDNYRTTSNSGDLLRVDDADLERAGKAFSDASAQIDEILYTFRGKVDSKDDVALTQSELVDQMSKAVFEHVRDSMQNINQAIQTVRGKFENADQEGAQ